MTTTYWSTEDGNALLQARLVDPVRWLSLHVAEPTPLGDPSSEVLGGGYVRKRIIFGDPADKTTANINNIVVSGMPACVVLWLGVNKSKFGDDPVVFLRLPSPVIQTSGSQWLAAPGDIVIGID